MNSIPFSMQNTEMGKLMSMMVVVFLLALILSPNPVKATDCLSALANIFQCRNYLQNPFPITPGNQCCDAASNINVVGNGDIDTLCKCLRQNSLGFGFLPSKAQQLPNLCNLEGFSPLVNCLAPSEPSGKNIIIPFPPLTPGLLPPLIPIPPLSPGLLPPFIPIPPLTPGLLPPLIPIPPLTPGLPPWIPIPPLSPLLPPLIPAPPVPVA